MSRANASGVSEVGQDVRVALIRAREQALDQELRAVQTRTVALREPRATDRPKDMREKGRASLDRKHT